MSKVDYTIFYKRCYDNESIDCGNGYDLFLSAYDACERTKFTFHKILSAKKIWINFPHYGLDIKEDNVFNHPSYKEDEFLISLISTLEIQATDNICVDITGFIRPHLIFLIKLLHLKGIKKLDFLYSEPVHYSNAEDTRFSGFISDVKIIEGCGSLKNNPNTDNDVMIIASGYDDNLIAKVSQSKSKIKNKYYILGFPSLQADMYQENILKIYHAKESIGEMIPRFAPAFDPFVTAQVISDIIDGTPDYSNIYLSPLSTKPQTLGIALYYLWNFTSKPINIIFPYSNKYHPNTAHGIKKTWKYTIQLP